MIYGASDLDHVLSGGGAISLPFGTWRLDRHVVVPPSVSALDLNRSLIESVDTGTTSTPSLQVKSHPGLTITNGTIQSRNATGRTATHGLLWVEDSQNLTVSKIRFGRSPSTAVWMMECHGFLLSDLTISGTFADGIHISRGSRDGTVEGCGIYNTGDDGIGAISYRKTGSRLHDPCSNITIRNNTIRRVRVGRGIAIAGSSDITVDGNTIEVIDQCAVLVADFTNQSIRTDPQSVTIINNKLAAHGLNVPSGGRAEAVYVASCAGGRVASNTDNGTADTGVTVTTNCTNISRT